MASLLNDLFAGIDIVLCANKVKLILYYKVIFHQVRCMQHVLEASFMCCSTKHKNKKEDYDCEAQP